MKSAMEAGLAMDVNAMRTVVTVLSGLAFVGIWVWAWSRRNAAGFAEAAQLPLCNDVAQGDGP